MATKKLNAAEMLANANAQAAQAILEEAQESTKAPAQKRPTKKALAEPRGAGRPKGNKTCALNIKISPEDKDYLRRLAFERTTGNHIVTISEIIAEFVEADRKKQRKAKK